MKPRRAATVVAIAVTLAACQTIGPTWSEVTGTRFTAAIPDRAPVKILQIDGQGAFGQYPIKLEPGRHVIIVESFPRGKVPGGRWEMLTLDLQPCRRYYVNAQFPDPVQLRYTPVVDEVEPIAGCRPG